MDHLGSYPSTPCRSNSSQSFQSTISRTWKGDQSLGFHQTNCSSVLWYPSPRSHWWIKPMGWIWEPEWAFGLMVLVSLTFSLVSYHKLWFKSKSNWTNSPGGTSLNSLSDLEWMPGWVWSLDQLLQLSSLHHKKNNPFKIVYVLYKTSHQHDEFHHLSTLFFLKIKL